MFGVWVIVQGFVLIMEEHHIQLAHPCVAEALVFQSLILLVNCCFMVTPDLDNLGIKQG